jgi:hypothetical protein
VSADREPPKQPAKAQIAAEIPTAGYIHRPWNDARKNRNLTYPEGAEKAMPEVAEVPTGSCGRATRVHAISSACRIAGTLWRVKSQPSSLTLVCGALWLGARCASPVQAQTRACGMHSQSSSEVEVTPADRAQEVALDAPIIVRYPSGVDVDALQDSLYSQGDEICGTDLICVFRDASKQGGAAREQVTGVVRRLDALTVSFAADARFARESTYYAQVARAGFARATRREVKFTAGTQIDREAPQFAPSRSQIRLGLDTPAPECRAPSGSLRVQLAVPRAHDDGNEGSIEVLAFLSRARGLDGPVLEDRVRNPEADRDQGEVLLNFLLTEEQTAEPICVVLTAVDGVGRVSETDPRLCFDPTTGSVFAPSCAAGPTQGTKRDDAPRRTLIASAAAAVVALFRRRRARSTGSLRGVTRAT